MVTSLLSFMIFKPLKKVGNCQTFMLFHNVELFMIVTYRCLYQQDYCNIESRVRLGMGLNGEYYFWQADGRRNNYLSEGTKVAK